MTRWAFLDHPGPLAFAHRGGASEHPENTMPAFENAVRLGYRYLETDVHSTADRVLIAFHDDKLDRVTDRKGVIAEMQWQDVSQARLGTDTIPLMADLITAWPDVRFNIDIKHEESVAGLVEVLDRTKAHDRVCVGAFSGKRLKQFRALTGGRVCTSAGPLDIVRLRLARLGLAAGPFSANCTQVPTHFKPIPVVDRGFVDACHSRDLPVHVWTIDDPVEMERLLDLGVDGIMTDRPTVLKDVLVRRGQWF
jgi:glycerophosphoryl diester phosphodiesterase